MLSVIRSPRSLGASVADARRKAGLTQTELSRRTGLRQATISRLELGEGASVKSLLAIMSALRLELALRPRSEDLPGLDELF